MVTGRPLVSLVVLLIVAFATDRFTIGILPSPFRWLSRSQRASQLERELEINPHNRQARLELADFYASRRRYARVVEMLRPNLEAGDDEPSMLFLMAIGLYGTGHADRAETLMDAVLERDPKFRLGAVQLERGRWRLAAGDAAGAREALEALLHERTGTVEGRVLLSRAFSRLDQHEAAARVRNEAWEEYRSSPRHLRRLERLWAWRARPSRPLFYLLVILAVLGTLYGVVSPSMQSASRSGYGDESYDGR